MLRIALVGAGRMGQAIVSEIAALPGLELAGVCVRKSGQAAAIERLAAVGLGTDTPVVTDPREIFGNADVAIDFSLPQASVSVADAAVAAKKPLVCGVTGLDSTGLSALYAASATIPLLYDRNMSIGIAVMMGLVQRAAAALGNDFSASVVDIHHRHKRDAPSGTALKLGEALAKGRGREFQAVYHYDPDGSRDKPSAGDIVFAVTREGENPGEHSVRFTGSNEILQLTHQVTNRRVFAQGALRAACWLVDQRQGFYSLSDITA